jgi:hypothetical protein
MAKFGCCPNSSPLEYDYYLNNKHSAIVGQSKLHLRVANNIDGSICDGRLGEAM